MKINVIGSGTWGTALALVGARANNQVIIYSRDKFITDDINNEHKNSSYLPSINIPESIKATSNLVEILCSEAIIISIPAQNLRQICIELKELGLNPNVILIICSKGIEQNSLKLMSEVVAEILPLNKIAILSGPNFAQQVADDLPAITSIAANDINLSTMLANNLKNINFRIYPNKDIIGTQIYGAVKNVLAIASGISTGMKLGENAKAAIISRGIVEINTLSLAMGGKEDTLLSPAGIGDIHLTCSSAASRNTSYGIALANNQAPKDCLVEGFFTCKSINSLANKYNIQMPICQAVYKITHEHSPPEETIKELLNRPSK
jgi:glycerol-3-phosphate dehydrogenase (NAD(P)+)